jgi:hypothetical protein
MLNTWTATNPDHELAGRVRTFVDEQKRFILSHINDPSEEDVPFLWELSQDLGGSDALQRSARHMIFGRAAHLRSFVRLAFKFSFCRRLRFWCFVAWRFILLVG